MEEWLAAVCSVTDGDRARAWMDKSGYLKEKLQDMLVMEEDEEAEKKDGEEQEKDKDDDQDEHGDEHEEAHEKFTRLAMKSMLKTVFEF